MTINYSAISRNYFLNSLEQKESAKQILIENNSKAIFPLLREAVHVCKEFHPTPNLRDVDSAQTIEKAPESLWIRYVLNPTIDDMFEVVKLGEEDVQDALVRALYDQDPLVKIISALVMLKFQAPGRKLVEQLARTFDYLKFTENDKPYYRDSGLIIIISFILYQGGHPNSKELVNKWLSEKNETYEAFIGMWKNTLFSYLFITMTPS